MIEKISEINIPITIGISEAYTQKSRFVHKRSCIVCFVNAAEVNEIQRGSAHYEESILIVNAVGIGHLYNKSAFILYPELAGAYHNTLYTVAE